MNTTRTDLREELRHCKQMVAVTHNAIEAWVQDIELYGGIGGESERKQIDALQRQHALWIQLVKEYETYLAGVDSNHGQAEVLFS